MFRDENFKWKDIIVPYEKVFNINNDCSYMNVILQSIFNVKVCLCSGVVDVLIYICVFVVIPFFFHYLIV